MIVLDTDVISELITSVPHEGVKAWLLPQDRSRLHPCTVLMREHTCGAEKTVAKTGWDRYFRAIDNLLVGQFRDRVRPGCRRGFDDAPSRAKRENMGRPISISGRHDRRHLPLAWRNAGDPETKDFEGLDLKLVNPFEEG
jgi:hypothetical protein